MSGNSLYQSDASDHLLRTLASIPVGERILELGCGSGKHTVPLFQLGFDVFVCDVFDVHINMAREKLSSVLTPEQIEERISRVAYVDLPYPENEFTWIFAFRITDSCLNEADLVSLMSEAYRTLKMGGWIYVSIREAPDNPDPVLFYLSTERLRAVMERIGFVTAGRPMQHADGESLVLTWIFRKVNRNTPV
jgi:SAM-dependent methyltransferase